MVRTAERRVGAFNRKCGNTIHDLQHAFSFCGENLLAGRFRRSGNDHGNLGAFRQRGIRFKDNHTILNPTANHHTVIFG